MNGIGQRMVVTAFHLVNSLASGLYRDFGQCLMELVRNGVVASMNGTWEPKRAWIDIHLLPTHPLGSGEPVLVVLDHGCGLTDPMLKRYFEYLGTPMADLQKMVAGNGASQKGIGRLAALALNQHCHEHVEEAIKHGYYILSRTSNEGPVRFVSVIPELVEGEDFRTDHFIQPDATEMGNLKNIQGTFTAIIIPSPVFKNTAEIYEEVKWNLPREADKMFHMTINGKTVQPPPLEDAVNITSPDGTFRARLNRSEKDNGGIWLCDAETGIRVASCQRLGRTLPEPLWFPGLKGDIFAPGLLAAQNTSRDDLSRDFVRKKGKAWNALYMFLLGQVVQPASALLDQDLIRGDAANTLKDLVKMFEGQYGPPDKPPQKPQDPRTPTVITDPKPKPPGVDKKSKGNERYVTIKVRSETYVLFRGKSLHPHMFAEVSSDDAHMILMNVRGGYKALPKAEAARREHCLVQLLMAIGFSQFPGDPFQATVFANEVRAELMEKK